MIVHRTAFLYALAAFCVFPAYPGSALADGTAETALNAQMPFDSPAAGDHNGWQLDIHASTAIVGGPYGGNGNTKGWAQIFYNDPSTGWGYQDTLASADPNLSNDDQFGFGAAIDQDVAVVGALQNQTVYVFRRVGETWSEDISARLAMPDINNQFGSDLGVSNEHMIIGTGFNQAYIHTIGATWEDTPLPASGTKYDFGSSVGISGTNAIVGDPGTNTAYLYHLNGSDWEQTGAFSKPVNGFGSSVRICGDYAIVGGYAADGYTGLAAIYHRGAGGTWSEEATLTARDGTTGDQFGYSVDIGENYAIVGASQAYSDESGSYCGVSYIFQRNGETWTEIEKLVPQDGDWYDEFGAAVALDGDDDTADFVVGAWAHDSYTGTAYTHQRDAFKQWTPGDADRDNDVDADDAAILAAHWLDDTDVFWGEGDFNADGIVDDIDATAMAANWHYGVDPAASVPEPATLVLLSLGGLCLLVVARASRPH